MKHANSEYYSSFHIRSTLEIRLCPDTWRSIQHISIVRNCSYSWVVRYALFRFIKRRNCCQYFALLKGNEAYHDLALKRRDNKSSKHRHHLCLYGEDELLIRLTAAQLRCSMTHLVRLSLEMYLFAMLRACLGFHRSFFGRSFWFWLGIKVFIGVEFPTCQIQTKQFIFTRYRRGLYFIT